MKTRIQQWGNSLAIRIPKSIAKEAGLRANDVVELSIVAGNLHVHPILKPPLTLEELLRGVTEENLHGEWAT